METHGKHSEEVACSGRESPVQAQLLRGILPEGKCFMNPSSPEGVASQDLHHKTETPPLSPRSAIRLEVLMLSTIERCLSAKEVLLERPLYLTNAESKQDDHNGAQMHEKTSGKRKRADEEHLDTTCKIECVGNPSSSCPGQVIDSFLDADNGLDASPTSAIWSEWNESEDMDLKIKGDAKLVSSEELPFVPEIQLEAQACEEGVHRERTMKVDVLGPSTRPSVQQENSDAVKSE